MIVITFGLQPISSYSSAFLGCTEKITLHESFILSGLAANTCSNIFLRVHMTRWFVYCIEFFYLGAAFDEKCNMQSLICLLVSIKQILWMQVQMVFSRWRNITDPTELVDLKIQMNNDLVYFGSVIELVLSSLPPKFNSVYCTYSGLRSNTCHLSLLLLFPLWYYIIKVEQRIEFALFRWLLCHVDTTNLICD